MEGEGAQERHRHRAGDQPARQLEVRLAVPGVHQCAAGLVDRGRGEVRGHDRGGVGEAEQDQGRGHQRPAAHAGEADDDPHDEADEHDGQRRPGQDLGHAA